MTGLAITVSTTVITVIISLMIAGLIKIMAIVLGKFSRPEHLPIEKHTGRLAIVEEASDESDIATAIAITRSLQKPFPVNY